LISSYFFTAPVVTIAYIGIKFYVIFKGIMRMIQQAFVKDMVSDEICLKIDQLSGLIGLTFITFITIFPKTFISFFFGSIYVTETWFFFLLALSAFIYSLFSSITTKALLEKKDNKYALISAAASVIAIICLIIFSTRYNAPIVISLSLLTGECIFIISTLYFLSNKAYLKERLVFYAKNFLFVIIPVAFRIFFSDAMLPFLLSIFLFWFFLGVTHFKKFNILS
jgi:O-antigen/teichoic acid export membrane protein